MAKTYHLLKDLGIYKRTVQSVFDSNDRGTEHNTVRDLLARKTQQYTLDELSLLAMFFHSSHDDCVEENPEEYTPLEVYVARKKVANSIAAQKILQELIAKHTAV